MYYDRRGFPVPMMEWARSFENTGDRIVRQSRHKERGREFFLSTVFLGLDHNFHPGGRPLIYETMVFDIVPGSRNAVIGDDGGGSEQQRWSTEDEARAGHDPWAMTKPW